MKSRWQVAAAGAWAAFGTVFAETMIGLPAANGAAASFAFIATGVSLAVIAGAVSALVGLAGHAAWRILRPNLPARLGPVAIHAALAGSVFFVAASALASGMVLEHFRDPGLSALVVGVFSLLILGASIVLATVVWRFFRDVRITRRHPQLDPMANARAATVLWLSLAWISIVVLLWRWPRFAMVFPTRVAISITMACVLAIAYQPCFGAVTLSRRSLRAGGIALLAAATLSALLIDSGAARRAVHESQPLSVLSHLVRVASDLDRDGFSSLFGGGDCAPLDASVHPQALDRPADGVDQNCAGGDFVPTPWPSPEPDVPLPAALRRSDYNILFITIDTARYDRTGAGGFPHATTPTLDAWAARGAWFENFYSTGSFTRHVIPTIAASHFYEALPLGERIRPKNQSPRKLKPEAVTFAERFAASGYQTGMFTGHRYFDGWGLDQGMKKSVNLRTNTPYRRAPEITDAFFTWVAGAGKNRWLAWLHYFEPHYPYVRHEGIPPFGRGETGRYAGELRFVDNQLARLDAWLAETGLAKRTIIVVTSDHGEELRERGHLGHGGGLWQYLVHVPLVVVVPGAPPRRVTTPASSIDIAPTLTALAGIAPARSWIGRAHIGEIAHGKNDRDRIVFSVIPDKAIFAVVTSGWKLLHDARANTMQLVDLERDTAESDDARNRPDAPFVELKKALTEWRERVLGAEFLVKKPL